MLKSFIGTKQFYKTALTVMAPVILQNVVTHFVNLMDNIMVGQVGTEQMSGVAITNQLIFVFNLCIFGGLAGAGIYTSQFYGKGDNDGVRHTVRFKYMVAIAVCIVFALVFIFSGDSLIQLFLHEGEAGLDLEATRLYSNQYLHIIILQLLPFALSFTYASTLRETKDTILPMKAGVIAVLVNLVGNYILIFGKFGAPELGVEGAAIATVIARFTECAILIIYSHTKKKKFPFLTGLFKGFSVPRDLVTKIAKKGTPLIINECLWAAGMAMLNQCYSVRGLEVVSATNISSTIANLFYCTIFASGSTISIIVGQRLGAGKLDEAVKADKQIILLSIVMCMVMGGLLAIFASLITGIYNTADLVKGYATIFLYIIAIFMPFNSFTHSCYFTLRSGGKTIITFIFDSVFTWIVFVPVAFVLSRYTGLDIIQIYFIVNALELIKCVVGFFMLKSKTWVVNLVSE